MCADSSNDKKTQILQNQTETDTKQTDMENGQKTTKILELGLNYGLVVRNFKWVDFAEMQFRPDYTRSANYIRTIFETG